MLSRGQYERVRPVAELGTFLKQLWRCGQAFGSDFGWPYLAFVALPFGFLHRLTRAGRRWLLELLATFVCVGPLLLAMLNPTADAGSVQLLKSYFAVSYLPVAVWLGLGLILVGAAVARPKPPFPMSDR